MIKTNITNLITEVSKLQREFNSIMYYIRTNPAIEEAKELTGDTMVLKEVSDAQEKYNHAMSIGIIISRYKGVIAKHNVNIVLKANHKTIAETLIDLQLMRAQLDTINQLLEVKPSKRRVSEQQSAYYFIKEPVWDTKKLEEMKAEIEEYITKVELEINQVNSELFEIY